VLTTGYVHVFGKQSPKQQKFKFELEKTQKITPVAVYSQIECDKYHENEKL